MNPKKVAKGFAKYLRNNNIPCEYKEEDGLQFIEITWMETENFPEFNTMIFFEEFGVTFNCLNFITIDTEDRDEVLNAFFVMNGLTADSPGTAWYITDRSQIVCKYFLYGTYSLSNEEYYDILDGVTDEVMKNYGKLAGLE